MLHILRDRRTLLVVLVIPLMLIMLFGFTVSTDVNNIKVMVCAPHRSYAVAEAVNRMTASRYFEYKGFVDAGDIDQSLRTGKAAAVVVFADDYDVSGKYQLLLDGADVNTARTSQAYLQSVLSTGNVAVKQSGIQTHMLFNPQMKSSFNFVPGIMGMIFLLICAMMTSISIVREKERGTMEVLLVSPVKPLMVIVAKAVPYLILAICILVTILLMARFVLDVPLQGSLVWILLVSMIYILLALSLGLLISNIAQTQLVALLLSAMVLLMPVVMLSGMLFPVESMPVVLQWVSALVPPRYYIEAMRKLMIMGVGIGEVAKEVTVLVAMTVFFLAVSLAKFNKRLE